MAKQILLPPKKKAELIKDFKTTRPTLWSALRFDTDSPLAKRLRAAALERGGILYDETSYRVTKKSENSENNNVINDKMIES